MSTQTTIATDLYHEVRGSGPAVLYIAGASGDVGSFGLVSKRLGDEFTGVAYDRRGNSRSRRLPQGERMSIAGQADDAAQLIEALGLAPAVVLGTSGGGDILLELIARRPEVVRAALVHEPALIAPLPEQDGDSEWWDALLELAARDPRAAMETFLRRYTSDETFEKLDLERRERVLGNGANFFANELEAYTSYVPDLERIRASGVPIRLLASRDGLEEDRVSCAWLSAQLDVEIEYVSGHHAPYAQDPDRFAQELRPLLREFWASRAS